MLHLPHSPEFAKLIQALAKLPGIGPKSAQRLAFFILEMHKGEAGQLAESIKNVSEKSIPCPACGFPKENEHCSICDNAKRNKNQLCVVEKAQDMINIEKTGIYHGLYHSLGGLISPIDGVDIEDLRIGMLLTRLLQHPVSEVILALSPNMEGEITTQYLAEKMKDLSIPTIVRLSQGLPMGSHLEYLDSLTLAKAMTSRVSL